MPKGMGVARHEGRVCSQHGESACGIEDNDGDLLVSRITNRIGHTWPSSSTRAPKVFSRSVSL